MPFADASRLTHVALAISSLAFLHALPFADASRLAHVALARYKYKKEYTLASKLAGVFFFVFATLVETRIISLRTFINALRSATSRKYGIFKILCYLPVSYGELPRALQDYGRQRCKLRFSSLFICSPKYKNSITSTS